jgi:RNA polymerase-binding transcription factor DksA
MEQHSQIRELIYQRIAHILNDVYGERMTDFSRHAISAHLSFKADPRLNELRLALDRMDRGEYGRCIFCKSAIEAELLRENPTAHFCRQCSGILRHRTSHGAAVLT